MIDSATGSPGQTRDADQLFRALSHRRRRAIIRALREVHSADLRALATAIARDERDGATGPPDREIESVRIELYHRHVPVLIEADLVDHGERRDGVVLDDRAAVKTAWDLLDSFQTD